MPGGLMSAIRRLTITCSRGDDSRRDAIQMPQITFLVRPMLHHERDFIGWTITAYLQHIDPNLDSPAVISSLYTASPKRSDIFTAQHYTSAVYAVVRCPSVCHKPALYSEIAKHRITQIKPYNSPGILVFCRQSSRRNSNGSPTTGAPNESEVGSNPRFSTISQKRCKIG